MEINILATADDIVHAVSQHVAIALRRQPDLVLGVPAGRTPVGVYAELGRLHAAGAVDFSRATAFAVDEFVGIGRMHPGSFHRFISEHLVARVNLSGDQFYSLDGAAEDPDAECARYEDALSEAGGVGGKETCVSAKGFVLERTRGAADVAFEVSTEDGSHVKMQLKPVRSKVEERSELWALDAPKGFKVIQQ